MSANQRQAARKFREYWTLAPGRETGEDQQFWNSLLGEVLGVEDVKSRIKYQLPVPMRGTTKYLDAWIPETRVLIEHKSRGVKLGEPQSGHGGKTPYQQALEYNQARGFSEKARWIVTCNFDEIWVYDMDRPLADPQKIRLADLPREVSRLNFLVDTSVRAVRDQEREVSVQAGRIVGKIYDELLKRYAAPENPDTLKALNRLCVRLVFCFYAEDAGIFPKDCLWNLLNETPAKFLRDRLLKLFRTLDTPDGSKGAKNARDPYLEPELAAFPYTNGGLFRGVDDAEIPPLDDEIKALLIRSSDFDWRGISPTIFGALFESTLNPETRRAGGMVYTSVENIHKVIDPLFLDDLAKRVESLTGLTGLEGKDNPVNPVNPVKNKKALFALQEEMASLTFLDPACGSGNFLTETYLSLRRLENRIIAALQKGQGELDLGVSVKVSIGQFHGIEINDFAVAVAATALWIAEAQMLTETADILHREPDYLPLHDYDGIIEGNALRMDWLRADYIMGNPPFVGARNKSKDQAADMEAVFGKDWSGLGNLDYVTAWYKKAVDCVFATKNASAAAKDLADRKGEKVAFVSTNSICQGDGVAALWKPLFEQGLEIDFAHRTFRWDNESFEKAHVHCVIVGFHVGEFPAEGQAKTIFDNGKAISAAHINGYLMDAPDAWIESRTKPLCDVPPLIFGSMPNDGGFLSDWSDEERNDVVARYPAGAALFRRFMGATEFINNRVRWCLWLKDASPSAIRAVPPVMEAVSEVQKMRTGSSRASTRKLAETPTLFGEIRQPNSNYLLVPCHSSENRRYIPLGYIEPSVICGNANLMIPSATLYHFGVLTSSVHMAWMRAVAGRLKSDYRYSAAIVYNNFPWPDLRDSATPREKISQTAQTILDVRGKHPDSSLADLYDPLTMPPDLRAAHTANDRAVLAAYGLKPDTPEPEIVAHLFKLYAAMTK